MNYIAYKQIDGTITSGFKVKLYDIVTLNVGYWKDKLAIVLYINEDKKQIKVRIIKCGMNLTLKVKDVQFVNHNNRTAARSYIDLCNKLSKTFRDKYTDKHYIKDNWFTDKFIINDITADTIAKGIGQYITNIDSDRYSVSAIMWLSDIKDYIDALLKYGDFDFVAKAFKIYNITDTRFDSFVNFIIISMIENVSHFILGMIFGLSVYLFIRITIVSKKPDRLIRDINDTQNWIRKIQIDICDINKQWEVKRDRDRNRLDRIEDRIGKLTSDFNDIIRKKV
nr:MAG: hypothetical protein [Bacteriophage sp.]